MARHDHPSKPQARHAIIGAARRQRLVGVTEGHRQPVTALTVIMAVHHRSVEPQARPACYGRGHPVNDSDVTEHHRPLRLRHPGASSWRFIIDPSNPTSGEASLLWTRPSCQRLGRHRPTGHCPDCRHGASSSIRRTPPQARQACYGGDHPVNDSQVTDRDRQPVTALTVIMAVHHRSVEPQARPACYGRGHPVNDSDVTEHHRPPRWRSSGRIICIRRTPNGALSCERGHPVNSADRHLPGCHAGCTVTSTRGSIRGATGGM